MNILKATLVIIGTATMILTFFTKDYTRATYILLVLLWTWKLLDWNDEEKS